MNTDFMRTKKDMTRPWLVTTSSSKSQQSGQKNGIGSYPGSHDHYCLNLYEIDFCKRLQDSDAKNRCSNR